MKKIDNNLWDRLIEKIEDLKDQPFPKDAKRVKGIKEKTFRIRVGDYRILYVIFREKNQLLISKIEKRSKIYN